MRSPASLVVAFVLGACATAAVQAPRAAPTDPAQAPAWMPPVSPVIVAPDAAERRVAPGGKATVTILARGREAFLALLDMQPGAAVPLHRDATEEYIHVLSGGGTITVDGTAHAIGPGTTVYMPADAEVQFQNGDAPLTAIQVFAGPEPAAKYGAWTPE